MRKLYGVVFFMFIGLNVFAHSRLYVCILADDTPENFMGGSSLGSGLWVSDDTGKTFVQLGWKHGKTYSAAIDEYTNGKTIYIARGDGLLGTTDGGMSWRMLTDWRQTEVMDVAVDKKLPGTIYIATAFGNWRSDDAGKMWQRFNTGWADSNFLVAIGYIKKNKTYTTEGRLKKVWHFDDSLNFWKDETALFKDILSFYRYRQEQFSKEDPHPDTLGEKYTRVCNVYLWYRAGRSMPTNFFWGGKNGLLWRRKSDENRVFGDSLRNVKMLERVGNTLFIGTLDTGLFKLDMSSFTNDPVRCAFPKGQIWMIRTYELE